MVNMSWQARAPKKDDPLSVFGHDGFELKARWTSVDYIDNFYNPTRRHSTLGNISPIEYKRRLVKTNQIA